MADMSQAVQECIDDYFKREAGGTGLLASTQPLSSAQPLGAGIPHQRGEGPLVSAQPSSSLLASAQPSGAGIPHQRQSQGGGEGPLVSAQPSSSLLASAQPSGAGIPHQRQSQGGGEGPLVSAQPSSSLLASAQPSGAGIPHQRQSQGGGEGPLVSAQPSSSLLASAQPSGAGIPHQRQSQGGGEGPLVSAQPSSSLLASAQPSGAGIPHQRQSQGGGEGPLVSAQPSGAGIPHQHQSQGGGEGPLASGLSREVEVPTEQRAIDLAEVSTVKEFCSRGCGCEMACTSKFSLQHIELTRANAAQLSRGELDMAIMGQVMAFTSCSQATLNSTRHRHKPKQRQKNRMVFYHNGYQVCRNTFLFLHKIGKFCLDAIKSRYVTEGMVPHIHGHSGRTAPNALVLEDVRCILQFVMEYVEINGILLPGRIPGYKRDDIQLLPSSTTKRAVWLLYQDSAITLSARSISYSTFCNVWRKFLGHVVVSKPMTDLCETCQRNVPLLSAP